MWRSTSVDSTVTGRPHVCILWWVGRVSCPVSAALHSCVAAHWSKYHCYKQAQSWYDLRCFKSDVKPKQTNKNGSLLMFFTNGSLLMLLVRILFQGTQVVTVRQRLTSVRVSPVILAARVWIWSTILNATAWMALSVNNVRESSRCVMSTIHALLTLSVWSGGEVCVSDVICIIMWLSIRKLQRPLSILIYCWKYIEHVLYIYRNMFFLKGSLTVRGVGMFMSLFERIYKV